MQDANDKNFLERLRIVMSVTYGGMTTEEAARHEGLPTHAIRRWVYKFSDEGEQGLITHRRRKLETSRTQGWDRKRELEAEAAHLTWRLDKVTNELSKLEADGPSEC